MKKMLGAAALSVAVAGSALVAAPASAGSEDSRRGNTSLAEVLGEDGVKFDKRWGDFDIVEAAAYAVIDANPDSPVALLADGKTRLTAFVPTDKAFRRLVQDLTGDKLGKEKKVFKAVAGLGIDTVETVLLYHVVPGATLTSDKVLKSDGAELTTALDGATVTVKIKGNKVKLDDANHALGNPTVAILDINRGNKQIAHGITRVLSPTE